MKSASYYSNKAANCVELGRWSSADEWRKMATKARAIEKKRQLSRR